MVDADFYERLDLMIAGKPSDERALTSQPLHDAYAEFHGIPTLIHRCPPDTIKAWFKGYESLWSPMEVRSPEKTATYIGELTGNQPEGWRTALGDSILRNLVLEYDADTASERDWSGCDVEVRHADGFRWEYFSGDAIKVDPVEGKFAVCERVLPEMMNGYDVAPLRGLPAKLATRFKQHQFDVLRDLAGSVEAMAKCKFGVAVYLSEKPRLSIGWDRHTEELVFGARGYFGAAVIS